jgi:hypothetical protein
MQRMAVVFAVLVATGGCKKKGGSSPISDAVAKMEEFSKKMCDCKDKACADKVNDDMTKWGVEMAKTADRDAKPDPELAKKSADIMQKYTECMTKIMMAGAGMGSWELPPVPKSPTVDTLLKAARDSAAEQNKTLAVAKIEARYVRSDGQLDPTYGSLEVGFGQFGEKDDPNRPIGAPVPEPKDRLTECPVWTLTKGAWQGSIAGCSGVLAPARCNLKQIWERAIKEAAPAAGLATISLAADGTSQQWSFSIIDEPRKIDIRKTYADDCEPVVEQPR